MTAKPEERVEPSLLIVDDDPDILDLLAAAFEDEYQVGRAASAAEGLAMAHRTLPDLILLDVRLPDVDGYQLCRMLKEEAVAADIPVIFMTASADERELERAFAAGGVDFVRKPISLVEVRSRLRNQLRIRRSDQQLARQALYDRLTDLPNRSLSLDRLEQALVQDQSRGRQTALLCIDLDAFKSVNDTQGYEAGDQILLQAAGRIAACLGPEDTLGRLGADEFLVVLPALANAQAATRKAKAIVRAFDAPFLIAGLKKRLSVSIGIALAPKDANRSEKLLASADAALADAKVQGKATINVYSTALERSVNRKLLVGHHLFAALEQMQLVPHYQAKLDLRQYQVAGAEALLRWTHPDLGEVSPEEFVKEAERAGLIWQFGEFALRRSCEDLVDVRNASGQLLDLAVNVSAQQIRRPDFATMVASVLQQIGFAPERLELELTENLLLNLSEVTERNLNDLRELGVRLTMDDFGTGYSSLSYLSQYPFDVIKIDRSFVIDSAVNRQHLALVAASISMAQAMNLHTVAEGVETAEQLRTLIDLKCDYAQGFLISRALPLDDFRRFLASPQGLWREAISH